MIKDLPDLLEYTKSINDMYNGWRLDGFGNLEFTLGLHKESPQWFSWMRCDNRTHGYVLKWLMLGGAE